MLIASTNHLTQQYGVSIAHAVYAVPLRFQVKAFGGKAEALKAFNAKFKSKAGVDFANRGAATSNAGGKYRTLTEQRVAAAGGRVADAGTLCFCLSWDDRVDLDLHCRLPTGDVCYFCNKTPTPYATLDVDKQAHHFGNQVNTHGPPTATANNKRPEDCIFTPPRVSYRDRIPGSRGTGLGVLLSGLRSPVRLPNVVWRSSSLVARACWSIFTGMQRKPLPFFPLPQRGLTGCTHRILVSR